MKKIFKIEDGFVKFHGCGNIEEMEQTFLLRRKDRVNFQ